MKSRQVIHIMSSKIKDSIFRASQKTKEENTLLRRRTVSVFIFSYQAHIVSTILRPESQKKEIKGYYKALETISRSIVFSVVVKR